MIDIYCNRNLIYIYPLIQSSEILFELVKDSLLFQGFAFAVDALKSILLTFATMENKLTVEEAVALSRLEVNVQVRNVMI